MAETPELDDATRERIFQEELARRSAAGGSNFTWQRFRGLAWHWQAGVWLFLWPVPLVLLALRLGSGRRRWTAVGAVAAAIVGLVVVASAVAPPEEPDPTLTAAARPAPAASPAPSVVAAPTTVHTTTTVPPTTAPPTTAAPTTVPPTTVVAAQVAPAARMPDVVCMNLQVAQDTIQRAGVFFSRSHDATGADRFQVLDSNWIVVGQNIAPGDPVGELEAVLEVVKYGEPAPC